MYAKIKPRYDELKRESANNFSVVELLDERTGSGSRAALSP